MVEQKYKTNAWQKALKKKNKVKLYLRHLSSMQKSAQLEFETRNNIMTEWHMLNI